MWCPAFSALLTCRLHGISVAGLGWRWPGTGFFWASYLLPAGYALAAYVLIWATNLGSVPAPDFIRPSVAAIGIAALPAWAAWHYPILLFGDYNAGTSAWFGLSCFTVSVIGMSVVYTWFRLVSGSLWTTTFLHASHNTLIQAVFTPLTGDTRYADARAAFHCAGAAGNCRQSGDLALDSPAAPRQAQPA